MKNPELHGVGTVFRYTVQQHYKTPSVLVFLVILFLLAAASMPLMLLMSGHESEVEETKIHTLYLRNECGFSVVTDAVLADERYQALKITETDENDDALSEKVLAEADAAAAVVSMKDGMLMPSLTLRTVYGENGDVTSADAETLNHLLENALHDSLMASLSITKDQEAIVNSGVTSRVARIADYRAGAEESNTDTHVFVNMFYCYFIMILCGISIGYVFQQCMEEKVSKLVESLLVSVSPTALLTGKLLAVMLFVFSGLAVVGLGFFVSFQLIKPFGGFGFAAPTVENILHFSFADLHFTLPTILLFVVCILIAFAMCAGLSGISGSCCSKTEDTQQASLVSMTFLLTGYLAGAFAPMFESDAVNIFCSLFPVTSVFTALPNYACGKIGLPLLLLALVIQALTVLFLMRTAGRVYKMMLLYRGGVPKPAQIIRMLKENKAAEKAAAGKEAPHAE